MTNSIVHHHIKKEEQEEEEEDVAALECHSVGNQIFWSCKAYFSVCIIVNFTCNHSLPFVRLKISYLLCFALQSPNKIRKFRSITMPLYCTGECDSHPSGTDIKNA